MKAVFMGFLMGCCGFVWGQAADELLQHKLNAVHSMKANFTQVVKMKTHDLSTSSGQMALLRPGKFFWQILSPMEQLVVADGKQIWVYDKDLEQVTVKKQDRSMGGTIALFLSGYNDKLTQDFTVAQEKKGDKVVFDLKAKAPKANFQKVKLVFKQNELISIVLLDQLGQTTIVKLDNIQSNIQLKPELFQFKPPKGVDVIRN